MTDLKKQLKTNCLPVQVKTSAKPFFDTLVDTLNKSLGGNYLLKIQVLFTLLCIMSENGQAHLQQILHDFSSLTILGNYLLKGRFRRKSIFKVNKKNTRTMSIHRSSVFFLLTFNIFHTFSQCFFQLAKLLNLSVNVSWVAALR